VKSVVVTNIYAVFAILARYLLEAGPMNNGGTTSDSLLFSIMQGAPFKDVLCWVNSSEKRDWIVKIGRIIADSCEGRCHIVMCLDTSSPIGTQGSSKESIRRPLTPEVISQAGGKLRKLYKGEYHTMVLPGHPIAEIRRYALTRKMGLIVMGEQALDVEAAYGERLSDDVSCQMMILVKPGNKGKSISGRSTDSGQRQQHER
jgi:nucleotide-binding universal stress UspA family protein